MAEHPTKTDALSDEDGDPFKETHVLIEIKRARLHHYATRASDLAKVVTSLAEMIAEDCGDSHQVEALEATCTALREKLRVLTRGLDSVSFTATAGALAQVGGAAAP